MSRQEMIVRASEIAYEEDSQQVVGILDGKWVIRSWEDPEADNLKDAVIIGGDGEIYGGN